MGRTKTACDWAWRELGRRSKEADSSLTELSELAYKTLPKSCCRRLDAAIRNLRTFRSIAENEMIDRGGPTDLDIFFEGGVIS